MAALINSLIRELGGGGDGRHLLPGGLGEGGEGQHCRRARGGCWMPAWDGDIL